MSITLVSTPDSFALTKGGRMQYVFSGAGRVASPGVGAQITITVGGIVAAGSKLKLRWNGKDRTLKFVDKPSAPGEFTAGDGSFGYKTQLYQELRNWYPLREDYTISFGAFAGSIELVAKVGGPQFNMELQLPRLDLGQPFGVGTAVIGVNPILRSNYSVLVEVWLQKPGTTGLDITRHYSRAFSNTLDFDDENLARFDVGQVIHAKLSPDYPNWSFPSPELASSSHRKYFICYCEAWGFPLDTGLVQSDDVRHAYLGGADFRHRASAGLSLSQYSSATAEARLALRFGSATRYVRFEEPQFLSFVNLTDADLLSVSLQVILTYTDGTTSTDNSIYAPQKLLVGDKISYPVGYAQLDLGSRVAQNKTLQGYTVQLRTGASATSVVYRYILNGANQPYVRYFAYLSSLGCIDTLCSYGKGSKELSLFSDQAERYLKSGYDVSDGQFVDYNVSKQEQIEVATGFYPQATLRGWDDFYRSPNRFRLKSNIALPISIVSKSIKQAKDGDTQFAHKFEYVHSYKEDFYTAELDDSAGDGLPPAGFIPMGGQITVTQPVVVLAKDPSIPDSVRALTDAQIKAMLAVAARPDPQTLGFLTPNEASLLFRLRKEAIDYISEIKNKPTTRDEAGLLDVPTKKEIENLPSAGLRQPASDTTDTPDGLMGYVLDKDTGKAVSKVIQLTTALTALFKTLTTPQALQLKSQLRISLDDALSVGNESTRNQIIGGSHRRQLVTADKLEFLQGVVTAGNLKEERYILPKALALQLQALFDYEKMAPYLAPYLGTSTDPTAVQWVFGSLLACEDAWKDFGRDDFDNKDFQ